MAAVTCPRCGTENKPGRRNCRLCGVGLVSRSPSWHVPTEPAPVESASPVERGARPATVCGCGTAVPLGETVCQTCFLPVGAMPSAAIPTEAATEATPYVLAFPWGDELHDGTVPLGLGREPGFSPFAARLASFPTVSRRHARLEPAGGGLVLVHLSTTNATWLNGQPVSDGAPAPVAPGDEIHLSAECSILLDRTAPT